MPTISLHDGYKFQSEQGDSILEAAEKADLNLPYSCRTGRCSSCKCKILSGKSEPLFSELGLSEQEKAEGWALSCARSAVTDLTLDMAPVKGQSLPTTKMLPCRIHNLKKLAPNVMRVLLRFPPNRDFFFLPGQYIQIIGPEGVRRSYSLANASVEKKLIELHIRGVTNGAMSKYWFKTAKTDDLLRFNGPLGTFFLRDLTDLDLVFLATGTGIAPIKAMLESMVNFPESSRPRSISVYWGGRTVQDLYLQSLVTHLQYTLIPVLSRPHSDWGGFQGHVQHAFMDGRPDLENTVVYACGSNAMIQSAQDTLIGSGLAAERFFSDAFVCSADTEITS